MISILGLSKNDRPGSNAMVLLRAKPAWVISFIAAAMLAGSPALAVTQEQIDWCNNHNNAFSADLQISGCTAAIKSGRWSGKNLARAFVKRGAGYARKNDYDHAIADYTEAIRLDPKSTEAYNHRGVIYGGGKNDNDRALSDFNEVIRLNPNNAEAHGNRGAIHNRKQEYDLAIADLNEAIRLDPNFAKAYNNRGNALFEKREYDRAISDYTEAIRLDPKHVAALVGRCKAYMARARTVDGGETDDDRAIADCTSAININPRASAAWTYRGDAYSNKRNYDQAIRDYNEGIRLDPNWMWPHVNRGSVYQLTGRYDLAAADYSEAIRLSPDYSAGWTGRCEAEASAGQFDAALSDCNRAQSAEHKDEATNLDSLAFVYFKMGQFDKAITNYDAALKAISKDNAAFRINANVLYGRGLAKLKNGDSNGGTKDVEAAKGLNFDLAEQSARYGVAGLQTSVPAPATVHSEPLDSAAREPEPPQSQSPHVQRSNSATLPHAATLSSGAEVLITQSFFVDQNGSSSNLSVPERGTVTFDYVIEPGKSVRFGILTGTQFHQASTEHKVSGPPVMSIVLSGSGSTSIKLDRGDYAVAFLPSGAPKTKVSYTASYRR